MLNDYPKGVVVVDVTVVPTKDLAVVKCNENVLL